MFLNKELNLSKHLQGSFCMSNYCICINVYYARTLPFHRVLIIDAVHTTRTNLSATVDRACKMDELLFAYLTGSC